MKQYTVSSDGTNVHFASSEGSITGIGCQRKVETYPAIPSFPEHLHGKEVTIDVDFRLQHQQNNPYPGWHNCSKEVYELDTHWSKRIIAIPLYKEEVTVYIQNSEIVGGNTITSTINLSKLKGERLPTSDDDDYLLWYQNQIIEAMEEYANQFRSVDKVEKTNNL